MNSPESARAPGADIQAESSGLDLLLRIVEEEVRAKKCPRCAAPLLDCKIKPRELELGRAVIEVKCLACARTLLTTIVPQSEPGVASVR